MAAAEIEQDVGSLPDHEFAGLQIWWCKGGRVALLHHPHHRRGAARPARDIDISGARFFQRKTYILAAALDRRPVIEFVLHAGSSLCGPPQPAALTNQ